MLKTIVADSIQSLRLESPVPLDEVPRVAPVTYLGAMGAPQEYLYRLVRAARPKVVIETGVYRGISTAFILAALEDNRQGALFSIDMPSAEYIDPDFEVTDSSPLFRKESVGFAVPDELRSRWRLILGDARKVLPRLLGHQPEVDFFYHDSEHSYSHMTWEYEQVLPHITEHGFLTSDDTNWNTAFVDCARRWNLGEPSIILGRLGVLRIDRRPEARRPPALMPHADSFHD